MNLFKDLTISKIPNSPYFKVRLFFRRYQNACLFMSGFLFDVITMRRIDAWTDLTIQLTYLISITGMMVGQTRTWMSKANGSGWGPKLWSYNAEALHFLFGGLFSAYVVLYFKSTTDLRALAFFVLLIVFFIGNEFFPVHRMGVRIKLAILAFSLASFLIYFVPIMAGRMGGETFALSLALAGGLVWALTPALLSSGERSRRNRWRLAWPSAVVLCFIGAAYVLRIIPPVPLSVRYQGVFHNVEREGDQFQLTYEKPPAYFFWRRDSRPFSFADGDAGFVFVRIFAPTRFQHRVVVRWELWDKKSSSFLTTDRIPLEIRGGRLEGYRGVTRKSRLQSGLWRVRTETADGRTIGSIRFRVKAVDQGGGRDFVTRRM